MIGYTNGENRKVLERFDDKYLQWFDTRRRVLRLHRKLRSQKTADLLDVVDMIELLIERHQMYFMINRSSPWKLFFPYMFIKPDVGEKIRNKTTGEEYEIIHVQELPANFRRFYFLPHIKEPKTDIFTGLIFLKQGISAPDEIDELEFVNKEKNLIQFFEWGSRRNAAIPLPDGLDNHERQAGRFLPTITWTVTKVEPGSIGGRPFDSAKELKPRVREQFPDPENTYLVPTYDQHVARMIQTVYPATGDQLTTGTYNALTPLQQSQSISSHTITVYGQWFDNLVQFDCWSTNNQEANSLIYWFEDFMDLYTRVLKINGVQEVLYWQRFQDQVIERWRSDIDNRTVQYYFRTEKLRVERTRNFRAYTLNVRIASNAEEILLAGEPTGITTYTGVYGTTSSQNIWDTFTGYGFTGTTTYQFTGQNQYLWGSLTIEQ